MHKKDAGGLKMMEIIGTVLKIGKVKDYGCEVDFGRNWQPNYKFFIQVDSKEFGIINAMVECKAERTDWGFKITEDAERQKPLQGDTVKFTTHQLKVNGATWASVTWKQEYTIIKKSKKARKERDAWIAEQKKEREEAWKQEKEESKQNILDLKLEGLGHLETQKYDERLPEAVREVMNKTFDFNTILGILRDTVWWVNPEGEGGKQAVYNLSGVLMEEGYPGTGLRKPGSALHGHPATIRKSILTKAINSGLIIETEEGYKATELGIKTLVGIDTCPECNELRMPISTHSHYANPASRYSRTSHLGATYHCKHEIKEICKYQRGCNVGNSFKSYKNTDKRLTEINQIAGVKFSTPASPIFQRVVKERGKRIIQVTKEEMAIIDNSRKIINPETHVKECGSKVLGIPTSVRGGLVCPDCGNLVLGGGIGSGMEVPNTKYRIIEED